MISEAIQATTVYFVRPGRDNTEDTLQLAKKRADELGIKTIVVATTKGDTGARAAEVFRGYKLIAVTHAQGWREPDTQEVTEESRAAMLQRGAIIHTATHIFGGVGRAVRKQFNTYMLDDLLAQTLRLFGEGMKVVCEMAGMCADAGLVRTDEDAVFIAGTGRGADTAVVLKPANTVDFFKMRVREVICKPRG
ncbi:MAG: pyruvate kinase alpha/beta domain-containing protein [Chloroflexota bacterium]